MRFFAWFAQVFLKSASEPEFYLRLLGVKLAMSVRFYLLTLFLLACTDILIFRLREVPQFISAVDQETNHILDALPANFSLVYSGQQLTFPGLSLPLYIPGSTTVKQLGLGEYVVTLTTSSEAANSFFTLTPSNLIVKGTPEIPINTQQFPYQDLFEEDNFSLTKTELIPLRQKIIEILPQMADFLALLGLPIWFFGLTLTTTVILTFLTLLTNAFSWILGIRIPFIKTFQLGLHAIAISSSLDVFKFLLFPGSKISLVVPGYLGIMTLVIWTLKLGKATSKS